ncbi:pyruvate dehydrogenase [Epidermidibacterium keratini]|uniref:Pyruvate dehydrogenase E1 component n=1 Tax=Epidermidibacterium keratini TaxID=1891644 RepID=A0A7L4YMI4_9ACTN|nr:transketolase C-terminal domain-containing protein [Epidermidibacterium keratini]QHC00501.1 pyruvate dehydrogenase [Epidermidibacterium keratini]
MSAPTVPSRQPATDAPAPAASQAPPAVQAPRDDVLANIQDRVLWLSTAIIDHANRVRDNAPGPKVGGHQASSASMVTIMTTLWLDQLRAGDRVSVKPHASPVLHALNYLLGGLDESYLTTLRDFGGLQSYPSRSKDPDQVDYSTGSVGIGATAPIWGALARRYVETHPSPEAESGEPIGRQYSLLGDAELDEGAVWETVLDPMVSELGEIVWIIDLNRQSLDRVVPNIGAARLQGMFAAAGWQVVPVKYGALLEELFAKPGGDALRRRIDEMPNPEYQRLLRYDAAELRARIPGDGQDAEALRTLLSSVPDDELHAAFRNLGGHDPRALGEAFAQIDDTKPTVIFAYTVKGFGLATEGHPQNHSALLTENQMTELASRLGMSLDAPWQRFAAGTPEAKRLTEAADRLQRPAVPDSQPPAVPTDLGRTPNGTANTQSALGRTLLDLNRAAPEAGARVVTVSPDVSSSTNLGGWVNKVGVWSAAERTDWFADDPETILHWRERPSGQHIELGIAETNLVGAIGELGATWSRWGQPLLPIGVLYDPFVERALEPWSFGIYAGGQSILIGTPSGVSLAAEGGAHQSIKTPSIGLEQPGCITYEPAFALDTEWALLASLGRLGRPDGSSAYLRLSTRPVDQKLAAIPEDPAARERRRKQVVAGGYLLRRAEGTPDLTIVAMGALITEALEAAERLAGQGFSADVVCVTSPDLLFRAVQARRGLDEAPDSILGSIFSPDRAAPMLTVLDGHPHTLAFLAGINRVPAVHLGVTRFGQAGDLQSVYRYHGIDTDSIVGSALDLVD